MAIRYSGDVEIRIGWDARKGVYRGTVRDPQKRWKGEVKPGLTAPRDRRSPRGYDHAARLLLRSAEAVARQNGKSFFASRGLLGRAEISRVFQAPCPT